MKILLIAGHGAGDPGATSKINGVTHKEAEYTREVVAALRPLLKAYGVDVDTYPVNRNAFTDITCGSYKFAVDVSKYDYALEIHFNSCVHDLYGNGHTTGTEIYTYLSEKVTTVEQKILNKICALGFTKRGVKRENFAVIRNIKTRGTSCALIEICFIDDADDIALYMKKCDKICQAIADGVAEGFGLKKVKAATTTAKTSTTAAKATKTATAKTWAIKSTAKNGLNIRKGPGTSYSITGVITDDKKLLKKNSKYYYPKSAKYTITEKKNGWGKLKSGTGWVYLAYTKEV